MKNILARGGIEFLAVLLGITASLWIDKNQNENENENERIKMLSSLQMEINEINIFRQLVVLIYNLLNFLCLFPSNKGKQQMNNVKNQQQSFDTNSGNFANYN